MAQRFTDHAQRVILNAQEESKRLQHDYVGTEHLLLGLLALEECMGHHILVEAGVNIARARLMVETIVPKGDKVVLLGEIPFTPRAKKVLELAVEEAQHMGHSYVGTEHLLLGMIREEDGVAARVMVDLDQRLDAVREETLNRLGEFPQPREVRGNRFTERAQRVILIAQEEARRLHHVHVGTEHVLMGLIALGEGVAAQVLANMGVDLRRVRSEVEILAGPGAKESVAGDIPFTPEAKKVLELGVEEAQRMGHAYVGTEHLLLGLIREDKGVAAKVMEKIGVRIDVVREEILNLLGESPPRTPSPAPAPVWFRNAMKNAQAFTEAQLQTLALHPAVTSVLITKKPHSKLTGRTMTLVLLKADALLDEFYGELSGLLTANALSLLEFKFPGRKPVSKDGGHWVEDHSFDETLNF